MRDIEHRANIKSGRATRLEDGENGEPRWSGQPSEISLRNFRGIEIKPFAAEVARLALIIAEYQCDEVYIGQKQADIRFLPLDKQNWIVRGNALRLDWLGICPPAGTKEVKIHNWALDLEGGEGRQKEIAFENEGGETYVCGNPPYIGGKKQSSSQKKDTAEIAGDLYNSKNLDYICAFFFKAVEIIDDSTAVAFVTTSSVNQGIHVPVFWKPIFETFEMEIYFAYEVFRWSNHAANNAGVYCSIIGLRNTNSNKKLIFSETGTRRVDYINPYLTSGKFDIVSGRAKPISVLSPMNTGNQSAGGGFLYPSEETVSKIVSAYPSSKIFFKKGVGTSEFFKSKHKYCLWIEDSDLNSALLIPPIKKIINDVEKFRKGAGKVAKSLEAVPHKFRYTNTTNSIGMIVPQVSSSDRSYLPSSIFGKDIIVTHKAHAIFNADLLDVSIFNSKMHFAWANALSGRLGNGLSYSSNLCWNTFPVPKLTKEHKIDLSRAAENILLAREAHFPATIADLYKPDAMPENLRAAHAENDRILEEIYIGRPFKNDTERLEKLFEMYADMTKGKAA